MSVILCEHCQQPRSFHKQDLCPVFNGDGSVGIYGPLKWKPVADRPAQALPLELPLPSGVFARIERVTFGQKMLAWAMGKHYQANHPEWQELGNEESYLIVTAMISVHVTFDGEKRTMQQVMDMDPADADACCVILAPYLSGSRPLK